MCDTTQPDLPQTSTDQYVVELKADWATVARYSVFWSQFHPMRGKVCRKVQGGLTYVDAKKCADDVEAEIRSATDYRSGLMGNPLALIKLDDPEKTYAAFQSVRAARRSMQRALAPA